jgi:hypothetical protein
MTRAADFLDRTEDMARAGLAARPGHPLYLRALEQLAFIRGALGPGGRLSDEDYRTQTLGLMCVKELRGIDDDICDLVFELLDEVRPPNFE